MSTETLEPVAASPALDAEALREKLPAGGNLASAGGQDRKYRRPTGATLPAGERRELLRDYLTYYEEAARVDLSVLNQKLPRAAFADLLDDLGATLLAEAQRMIARPGPVRDFLDANPLPLSVGDQLPDEFRAFCLALNALKQWVNAEQAATDRFLLGGMARKELREAAAVCIVTGEPLDVKQSELHHPVRDGRPPVLLSKLGHAQIEGQIAVPRGTTEQRGAVAATEAGRPDIRAIRAETHQSWAQLRRGCRDLLGEDVKHSTPAVAGSARSFARRVMRETGLGFQQILDWLDSESLGQR